MNKKQKLLLTLRKNNKNYHKRNLLKTSFVYLIVSTTITYMHSMDKHG